MADAKIEVENAEEDYRNLEDELQGEIDNLEEQQKKLISNLSESKESLAAAEQKCGEIYSQLQLSQKGHNQTNDQCIYLQKSNEDLKKKLEEANMALGTSHIARKELETDLDRFKKV